MTVLSDLREFKYNEEFINVHGTDNLIWLNIKQPEYELSIAEGTNDGQPFSVKVRTKELLNICKGIRNLSMSFDGLQLNTSKGSATIEDVVLNNTQDSWLTQYEFDGLDLTELLNLIPSDPLGKDAFLWVEADKDKVVFQTTNIIEIKRCEKQCTSGGIKIKFMLDLKGLPVAKLTSSGKIKMAVNSTQVRFKSDTWSYKVKKCQIT